MVVIVVTGINIFPAFTNFVQTIHKGLRNNTLEGVIYLSALVFGISGIVLLLVIQTGWNEWTNLQSLKISLCLACLSFAWCPFVLAPGDDLTTSGAQRSQSPNVEYNISDESLDDDQKDFSTMSPHLKLRFLTTIIQLVLLPAFFFLIATQYKLIPISNLYEGFINLDVSRSTFIRFSICALTGFSGHLLACMACSMRLHFAFVSPVILSTPITLFILMTADLCFIIFDNNSPECVTDISPIMIYSLCAGLCLYIGQVCSSTHTFMDKQSYGLTQEHEVRNFSY